jgi:broad specificity phosphatase PhoE
MKLLIARHAETNPNGHDMSQNGGVIGALSEKGKSQATKLAEHLKEFKIDYIYSSDILRSIATSYIVSDAMPDVTVMLTKDLRIKNPEESTDAFNQRVTTFLDGLKNKFENQTILLVSHSDVVQILLTILESERSSAPALGAVSEFSLKDTNSPVAIRVNDTSFLDKS